MRRWPRCRPAARRIPDEGLSVEIVGNGATLRPVEGLPAIRDADLNVRVTGRTATITLGKGTVEVSPGRRLAVTNGVFEVPDTRPAAPPARVRFRVEGPVPAAAELLALERLREFSGAPFDPATSRGTVSAQVKLGMPLRPDLPQGSTEYNIAVDISNFSADKMLFGQKVEAQTLRVTANNQRYEIKGDVKIDGAPAADRIPQARGEPDAEVRLRRRSTRPRATRLGFDLGRRVTGALPMQDHRPRPARTTRQPLHRRGRSDRGEDRQSAARLGQAGRPAGARGLHHGQARSPATRFEDVVVDGQGVLAKGTVELDANGDLQSANFPVFATSDGDKASLKADRGADGALRVVMRGDVYDGRNFVKSAMAGPSDPKVKPRHPDLDLDIKLGVVAGHNGEAMRGLDLRHVAPRRPRPHASRSTPRSAATRR